MFTSTFEKTINKVYIIKNYFHNFKKGQIFKKGLIKMSGRRPITFRISSHDALTHRSTNNPYAQGISSNSASFSLPITWPNELASGVSGVCVESVSIPHNEPNITEDSNVLYVKPSLLASEVLSSTPFLNVEVRVDRPGTSQTTNWVPLTISEITSSNVWSVQLGILALDLQTQIETLINTVYQDVVTITCDFPISNGQLVAFDIGHPDYTIMIRESSGTYDDLFDFLGFHFLPDGLLKSVLPEENIAPVDVWLRQYFAAEPVGSVDVITVTPGQYNIDELIAELNSRATIGSVDVSFSIDSHGRVEISTTSSWIIVYSDLYGSTIAKNIGLTDTMVVQNTSSESVDQMPNLHGPNHFFVHSSILGDHNSIDGDGAVVSILASIPVTVPYRHVQTYINPDPNHPRILYDRPRAFNEINITIRDERGRIVHIGAGDVIVVLNVFPALSR